MRNKLPRAVIFDWDNTLVDSWGAIAEAINYVRTRYGQPVWTMNEILSNCTRSARESFPDWFGDQWQVACDDYYAFFDKIRGRMGLHPTEGAHDLLLWLKEKEIPALVVSNKSGDYLRQEATQLDWNKYFVSIVGAHDAPRDKPSREHADHALKLAGLVAHPDIWFIGDSEADIACARNANLLPILIGNKESARKLEVEHFVADCRELLGLLNKTHSAIA